MSRQRLEHAGFDTSVLQEDWRGRQKLVNEGHKKYQRMLEEKKHANLQSRDVNHR
ncbi:MAG: hypothetical protein MK137_07890 [Rickettsiales bacterium]|nr:hypothetical protein [Rickettsiales bacterium]